MNGQLSPRLQRLSFFLIVGVSAVDGGHFELGMLQDLRDEEACSFLARQACSE
jgi:hypothetical protein